VSTVPFTDLVVVSPVYDDWDAVRLLLPRLDEALAGCGVCARVVLVNDGSVHDAPDDLIARHMEAISEISVLSLRRNLGHQRALAVGLAFVNEKLSCDAVVVMDADGEDDPQDIGRLLERLRNRGGRLVVFARRMRRSEGISFTLLYRLYRGVHRLLTGIPVQVGNFSVIPCAVLGRLVVMSDLWNHYAAAVFQSRVPYDMVPTSRAKRLSGTSRMNFVALVAHGLSAIAVFADRVGVRLLIVAVVALAATLATVGAAIGSWLWTGHAPAGWLIASAAMALILFVQTGAAASLFVLQVLFARGASTFIPARDYTFFVDSDEPIWRRDAARV
jgi:glycosyltransferase involved in cell wall biosynthesis